MNPNQTGWTLFIAALGMLLSLIGVEIAAIRDWDEILTPVFIGTTMLHIATVITAFIGGKLIPPPRDVNERTRATDK